MADGIDEQRTFRLLPTEDIGFSKPALTYLTAEGEQRWRLANSFKAPEPELARKADDPGWWTITIYLPVGATPLALVPDPEAPLL
ncbi:MAG: hypothetical protein JWL76_1870 [Thermoleophilia bacterium]|nr:hypothetical protein [Thermoleophilia bacterium]